MSLSLSCVLASGATFYCKSCGQQRCRRFWLCSSMVRTALWVTVAPLGETSVVHVNVTLLLGATLYTFTVALRMLRCCLTACVPVCSKHALHAQWGDTEPLCSYRCDSPTFLLNGTLNLAVTAVLHPSAGMCCCVVMQQCKYWESHET